MRQFFPCRPVWWGCDCSCSLLHSSRITRLIKAVGHILAGRLTLLNLHIHNDYFQRENAIFDWRPSSGTRVFFVSYRSFYRAVPRVQRERRQCVRQAYGLHSSISILLRPPLGNTPKRSYELVSIKKKKCCFRGLSPPPENRREEHTYWGYTNAGVPFVSLQVCPEHI